jgi:hypothetical protein
MGQSPILILQGCIVIENMSIITKTLSLVNILSLTSANVLSLTNKKIRIDRRKFQFRNWLIFINFTILTMISIDKIDKITYSLVQDSIYDI